MSNMGSSVVSVRTDVARCAWRVARGAGHAASVRVARDECQMKPS
jgi:hypothetical protein